MGAAGLRPCRPGVCFAAWHWQGCVQLGSASRASTILHLSVHLTHLFGIISMLLAPFRVRSCSKRRRCRSSVRSWAARAGQATLKRNGCCQMARPMGPAARLALRARPARHEAGAGHHWAQCPASPACSLLLVVLFTARMLQLLLLPIWQCALAPNSMLIFLNTQNCPLYVLLLTLTRRQQGLPLGTTWCRWWSCLCVSNSGHHTDTNVPNRATSIEGFQHRATCGGQIAELIVASVFQK